VCYNHTHPSQDPTSIITLPPYNEEFDAYSLNEYTEGTMPKAMLAGTLGLSTESAAYMSVDIPEAKQAKPKALVLTAPSVDTHASSFGTQASSVALSLDTQKSTSVEGPGPEASMLSDAGASQDTQSLSVNIQGLSAHPEASMLGDTRVDTEAPNIRSPSTNTEASALVEDIQPLAPVEDCQLPTHHNIVPVDASYVDDLQVLSAETGHSLSIFDSFGSVGDFSSSGVVTRTEFHSIDYFNPSEYQFSSAISEIATHDLPINLDKHLSDNITNQGYIVQPPVSP
jgi:hypothetical protein